MFELIDCTGIPFPNLRVTHWGISHTAKQGRLHHGSADQLQVFTAIAAWRCWYFPRCFVLSSLRVLWTIHTDCSSHSLGTRFRRRCLKRDTHLTEWASVSGFYTSVAKDMKPIRKTQIISYHVAFYHYIVNKALTKVGTKE